MLCKAGFMNIYDMQAEKLKHLLEQKICLTKASSRIMPTKVRSKAKIFVLTVFCSVGSKKFCAAGDRILHHLPSGDWSWAGCSIGITNTSIALCRERKSMNA